MDELSRLLGGIGNPGETRSLGSMLERGLVYGLLFGVLALACAFTVVGFLALAVYSAAVPAYGDVKAACLTAIAAAVLMGVLVLALRQLRKSDSQPAPRVSPLAAAAQAPPPKTIWDLVTLVAAGVLTGLAQKR